MTNLKLWKKETNMLDRIVIFSGFVDNGNQSFSISKDMKIHIYD